MYPIPQSPVSTTSGYVPHRPTPTCTFQPINPAAPLPASGSADQGSFNSLLNMVDSTQNSSPSSGSSIPCAQKSPANQKSSPASSQQHTPNNSNTNSQAPQQQTAANQQQFTSPRASTQAKNAAPQQPYAPAPQCFQQLPVPQQQQSPLLQPPAPGSHAAYWQQGQPQFIQLRVSPQGQPIRQPRQQSPLRQAFNPATEHFIPATEAQQNPVQTHQKIEFQCL